MAKSPTKIVNTLVTGMGGVEVLSQLSDCGVSFT